MRRKRGQGLENMRFKKFQADGKKRRNVKSISCQMSPWALMCKAANPVVLSASLHHEYEG